MRRKAWLLVLAGCIEGGSSSAGVGSTVDPPRILTVIAEPPESMPGATVRLTAVVAGTPAPLRWSLCSTARRPIDDTAVSPACASAAQPPLPAETPTLDVQIPGDACRVFGSETPAGTTPNQPDATGGYYQPLRVALGEQVVVARVRIQCQLASAPIDDVRAYLTRYTRNEAPQLSAPTLTAEGDRVRLRVELSPPELYPRYDPARGVLEDVRESQTVSWFVSAGHVTPELSEVQGTSAQAVWTLPDDAEGELWIVGRDDRGGTTSAHLRR